MKISFLKTLNDLEPLSSCVASFGFFDGLHKGHQIVLNQLLKEKKDFNLKSIVFTFNPILLKAIKKENITINSIVEQINLFKLFDIDYLYFIDSDEILNLSIFSFKKLILKKIHCQKIVVGNDFRFAKNKSGSIADLKEYKISIVDNYIINENDKLSSSKLRYMLENKNLELANKFLLRPYMISGITTYGFQNGHKINFPTINIQSDKEIILPFGVYFGYCKVNNQYYKAMISIGTNPTISENNKLKIEGYLLDFSRSLYNCYVEFLFLHFHRNEIKFSSLDELKKQLTNDKKQLRQYFIVNEG